MKKKLSHDTSVYLIGAAAAIAIITSTILVVQNRNQSTKIESLLSENKKQLDQKESELNQANSELNSLREELSNLKDDLEDLADDYENELDKNEEFEDQIRFLAGTLGDLDKLANTDEELLAKYSKVYFLNENYIPERLRKIDDEYILEGKEDQYFHANVIEHLEDMLEAAARNDIDLKVVSAYRSFDQQSQLKGQYSQTYGTGANAFSADQGYSEHQLGTTVDLTTPQVGGAYSAFANTEAYEWLLDNAYRYGFILSYPEENNFYIYEPWHWRFVGTDLARHLDRSDDTFYTMDQREINKYLINFFD